MKPMKKIAALVSAVAVLASMVTMPIQAGSL